MPLVNNYTWDLVKLPKEKYAIRTKGVYKTQYKSNDTIDKYKVCLVANGYTQKEGIDNTEAFFPVEMLDTIRMVLALAAQYKWPISQTDYK